jgi:hypothetical protein
MEALARVILPSIREYYESEEGRRALAEWKAAQEARKEKRQEKRD